MANTNAPFGARPVKTLAGGVISPNTIAYTIASGLAENIYSGDFVDQAGSATVDGQTIKLATAGDTNKILGVFAGVSYKDANGVPQFKQYWATGTVATDIKAYVYDNPNILFEIQSDATGVAYADVGLNVNMEVGTGSAATGQSGAMADASGGFATTATYQLRVRGMSEHPQNETGAYAKVLVTINNHRLANAVVGS